MKNLIISMVTLTLFSITYPSEAIDSDRKARISKAESKVFGKKPSSGLISFNSEEEKLHIDWSVTIPFISIPLQHRSEHGEIPSLLNVNTKPLGIVGLITALLSVITPLFSKTHPQHHYRSDDSTQWLQMGNVINEMIFNNDYVIPCVQQIVCSVVSFAKHTEHPTNTDKIIDGFSSYKWFKDFTNGTIVEEAIAVGQKGNLDCAQVYKDCLLSPKLLKIMMNELGIV
ncbi:uncharacterized protein LOC105663017 [Megachile rotundata]|uniref:uncharacterized protein LOC105663017 n=1 Tax=Megachile rotundata TaxID=143995 RepID=UPI000614A06D|nr:PREDICTED: uncharacterized protein LOC105663017 [Megachile rotundata]